MYLLSSKFRSQRRSLREETLFIFNEHYLPNGLDLKWVLRLHPFLFMITPTASMQLKHDIYDPVSSCQTKNLF